MRKRTVLLALLLGLVLVVASGCSQLVGGAAPTPEATPIRVATPDPTTPPAPTDDPAAETEDSLADIDGFGDAPLTGIEPSIDDTEADAEDGEAVDPASVIGLAGTPTPAPAPTLDPKETPISVPPLNKPTRVPLGITYATYSSPEMGVSFSRPAGWSVNAPVETNIAFIEPAAAAKDGYATQLTVRVYPKGSKQSSDDAKAQLLEVLEDMKGQGWSEFSSNGTSSGKVGSASGHYAYYTAVWNDIKVRGRAIVVAHGNSLYMMRITCPADYYIDYEDVYREVRDSWKFLSN